ncbi:MAG: TonB-dependent receptor plug domain-containing protein, partial [Flavobacteriales bacterium]
MCVWIYYTCRMTRINSSLIFLLLLLCGLTSFAQNQLLSGKIIDADSKSPLIGVSVLNEQNQGVSSDIDGNYELSLSKGEHTITFSFIGYETKKIQVNMDDGPQSLDVKLYTQTLDIDIVVISAGKFEQDLSEVTVSMDVLKPALIENKSTTNMEDLLQQSPGVSIVDGEPQIRSGSGYSFGAGSRVMILVDDLPILSGDAGRPSWGFLPVENVEQIEVIKGASSVLYGSAALSGVINIRTAYPKDKPLTKINTYAGVYSDPETSEGKYWNGNGILSGMNFLHSRRIGTLDLVIGGNVLGDDSYLGPIVDENG